MHPLNVLLLLLLFLCFVVFVCLFVFCGGRLNVKYDYRHIDDTTTQRFNYITIYDSKQKSNCGQLYVYTKLLNRF